MKLTVIVFLSFASILVAAVDAVKDEVPNNIADSVGGALHWTEDQFLAAAEAMPESKYDFIPTAGNFEGVRSFAEQVKHVACANLAFFNEIEGKTPPQHCEELVKYLRDSFDHGHRVLATINSQNALARVEGPYAGPNTKLGIVVAAVWHLAEHYGQIIEYLRMNGIVPLHPAIRTESPLARQQELRAET
jgi:uncharacterized damage-inducible protein DinB